jgi:hypothetical protein
MIYPAARARTVHILPQSPTIFAQVFFETRLYELKRFRIERSSTTLPEARGRRGNGKRVNNQPDLYIHTGWILSRAMC